MFSWCSFLVVVTLLSELKANCAVIQKCQNCQSPMFKSRNQSPDSNINKSYDKKSRHPEYSPMNLGEANRLIDDIESSQHEDRHKRNDYESYYRYIFKINRLSGIKKHKPKPFVF